MHPTDTPPSPDSEPLPAPDCAASGNQRLLEEVLRVSQEWLKQLSVHDSRRGNLTAMQMLMKDLIKTGNCSSADMTTARALLCSNCRRLNAAPEKCSGRSLDRCPLLKGPSP